MPCVPESTLPSVLEGFPWPEYVHTWDYVRGHFEDSYIVRFWYPETPASNDVEFFDKAWTRHIEVWRWFNERFSLVAVPEFETSGRYYGKVNRLAAFGRFTLRAFS